MSILKFSSNAEFGKKTLVGVDSKLKYRKNNPIVMQGESKLDTLIEKELSTEDYKKN